MYFNWNAQAKEALAPQQLGQSYTSGLAHQASGKELTTITTLA
jgi:hypothetical protein